LNVDGLGRKIYPWLKVLLTVLFRTAKVGANAVAPGLGLAIPTFQGWQQTQTLSKGLASAIGLSKDQEVHDFQGRGIDVNATHGDLQELCRETRKEMTQLLAKMGREEREEKIGLQKVSLKYEDGSAHGVAWVCSDCLKEIPRHLVCYLE
jgi:hypothetical protein